MRGNLKNSEEEVRELAPRMKILYSALFLAFAIVLTRLWYLQIINGQELRDYSEKNRLKATLIPPPRGLFLDRERRILVENLPGYEAVISPQYVVDLQELAEEVARSLNMEAGKIIQMVRTSRKKNGPFQPVVVKNHLSLEEVFNINRLKFDFSGLDIKTTAIRSYPMGAVAAQLFGYVGEISKSQIPELNEEHKQFLKAGDDLSRFQQGDIIGKSGLEAIWEPYIRGERGLSYIEVDARGRVSSSATPSFLGLKDRAAKPGFDLVLTIDKDIQEAAYKAMQRNDHIGPRRGAVVAMKANGEILAWVNTPSYDPNQFSYGIAPEVWSQLVNDPHKPLRNKVIQDPYSPGSTFKPIVALAALQEGEITTNTVIAAGGSLKFGRRVYHDHLKGGHGNITVLQALERSSNVFFYKMGISLGIDRLAGYARLLGLGQKTMIGLPNERSGNIPDSAWKARTYGEPWQPGENLSNAIGQGFVETTALQMAVAYNAIGLEGKVVRPIVVKQIVDGNNQVIKEFKPEILRDASEPQSNGLWIDKKHFRTVREGMYRVCNGAAGTARYWRIPGVEMAGKTGTSQVQSFSADEIYKKCEFKPLRERHHGSFVAFAPARQPEITVAVLAEHACAGSSGAAPIARDVIEAYMRKYHPEWIKNDLKATVPTPISAVPDLGEVE